MTLIEGGATELRQIGEMGGDTGTCMYEEQDFISQAVHKDSENPKLPNTNNKKCARVGISQQISHRAFGI